MLTGDDSLGGMLYFIKFTRVRKGQAWFDIYDRFEEPSNYNPAAGDIIFFAFSTGNHVGIVEAFDPITSMVYTIEGNSEDTVKRNKYSIYDSDIWGFGLMGGDNYGTIPGKIDYSSKERY